jgi:hypothetical protein
MLRQAIYIARIRGLNLSKLIFALCMLFVFINLQQQRLDAVSITSYSHGSAISKVAATAAVYEPTYLVHAPMNISAEEKRIGDPSIERPDKTTSIYGRLRQCAENFTIIQDKEGGVPTVTPPPRIPYVLHQTGKSRCISSFLYKDCVQKWHNHHQFKDMSYRFADDQAMDQLLYDHERWKALFPVLHLALKCIEHVQIPVMKADIWRYLILWEQGGIFADLDVIPDESLMMHPDYDAVFVLIDQNVLSQWFMATSPQHPLMYFAIQRATAKVLRAKRAIPIQHTGPQALNVATRDFLSGTNVSYSDLTEAQEYVRWGVGAVAGGSPSSRRGRSFQTLPAHFAKNLASKSKAKSYKDMNMTHYASVPRGYKYNRMTCLEFLGGTFVPDGFMHEGIYYNLSYVPSNMF